VKRTMRAPIRSESDAFRFTLAGALLLAVALVIGWLTQPRIGAAVFVVSAAALTVAYIRVAGRDRRAVLRNAAREPHPQGPAPGKRHVLIIANEALAGTELRERILAQDRERIEVDVLAPVLTSHTHFAVTDIDRELADARTRLERSLAWALEQGIVARGQVGDPSPTTAIEDELRDFGADEAIVVTHPRDRETWQERGELDRLRHELDVPVSHVVVGNGGPQPEIPA
jgi:hypothetical protein